MSRIRVIRHTTSKIPDSGSFEVKYPDGRESVRFYWDDNPGRRSIIGCDDQEAAKGKAQELARAEQDKLDAR